MLDVVVGGGFPNTLVVFCAGDMLPPNIPGAVVVVGLVNADDPYAGGGA